MRNEALLPWSLVFCLGLLAFGIGSAAAEILRGRGRKDGHAGPFISSRRMVRRLFTGAVLFLLGGMIFGGIHLFDFSQSQGRLLAYWGIILLLVTWLFLCPLFDISETRRAFYSRMRRLENQAMGDPLDPKGPQLNGSGEGEGLRGESSKRKNEVVEAR